MTDINSRYALLKNQFLELKQKYNAVLDENEHLRRHGSSLDHEAGDEKVVDLPLTPRQTSGNSDSGDAPHARTVGHSQSLENAFKAVASDGVDPATPLVQQRTHALIENLDFVFREARSEANEHLEGLRKSWQYRRDFFCMYNDNSPGYLVLFYHSATFVFAGQARKLSDYPFLSFQFSDLAGVSIKQWGVRGALSLQFLLHRASDTAGNAATADVRQRHVFWGFCNPLEDCQSIVDSVSASIMGVIEQHRDAPDAPISTSFANGTPASDADAEAEQKATHERRVVVDTYEAQRYMSALLGWSSTYLLPSDPPAWSDEMGRQIRSRPQLDASLPPGWRWATEWDVDTGLIGIVDEVIEGSPLHKAGLRRDDIVVRYQVPHHLKRNGSLRRAARGIQTHRQFLKALQELGHQPVRLTLFRPSWESWVTVFVLPVAPRSSSAQSLAARAPALGTNELMLGCKFLAPQLSILKGWEYGSSFHGPFSKVHRPYHFVRRRRWIREAVVDADHVGPGDSGAHSAVARPGPSITSLSAVDVADDERRRLMINREVLTSRTRQIAEPQPAFVVSTMTGLVSGVASGTGYVVGKAAASISSLFYRSPAIPAGAAVKLPASAAGATPVGDDFETESDGGFELVEAEIPDVPLENHLGLTSTPLDPNVVSSDDESDALGPYELS